MAPQKDFLNKTFYKLTVIGKREVYRGKYIFICKCECGSILEVSGNDLNKEKRKSCGCWIKPRKIPSIEERFWKFVEKTEDCWLWKGYLNHAGYGVLSIKNVPKGAHRISWIIHKGEIPKDMQINHNCPNGDNPKCVNPDHLWLGNQTDNIKDMYQKKRHNPLKGENTTFSKLTELDVKNIRILYKEGIQSSKLAKRFNVCKQNILDIVKRKAWKHIE